MSKYWSNQEDKIILDNYESIGGIGCAQLLPNRTYKAILSRAEKFNLKSGIQSKYSHNKDFFSKPSLENCYYAGFIAADGYLSTRAHTLKIEIQTRDKRLLENFKHATSYNGPIKDIQRARHYNSTKHKTYYTNTICISGCQSWYNDLLKHFNITPQKTFRLQPPNLTNLEHIYAFIIGYIDGDGSLFWSYNKSRNKYDYYFTLEGASEEFIKWVEKQFRTIIDREQKIFTRTYINQANMYRLRYVNKNGIIITNFLQNINTVYRLERKWNKLEHNPNITE